MCKQLRTRGSIDDMLIRVAGSALLIALLTIAMHASVGDPRNWAQWRGPDMTGVSRTAKPPIDWSETKNIKWKVEIPAAAHRRRWFGTSASSCSPRFPLA